MDTSNNKLDKLKNYFHLHFIIFIWGFTAILGALISIDSIPLVWYRMLLATVFLLIFILIRKKSIKVDNKMLRVFVFGGILIALHWILFFQAIKSANVSVALITLSTGAFFTSILEPIFFKRKLNFLELFLGLIVIAGLYVIFQVRGHYFWGIVFGLTASLFSASFSVLNGLYVKKNNPLIMSFYQLLFGVLFITVLLVFRGDFSLEFFQLSKNDWIFILILSSVCTAYAFAASISVMKKLSPFTVMLTINLEPIYGIILALIIFGEKEQMSPNFYYGALIILFSVLLNGAFKNRKGLKSIFQKKKN